VTPTRRGSGNVAEAKRAFLVVRRADGATIQVSDAFCRLMGRSPEEMLGKRVSDYGMSGGPRVEWMMERLPAPGQGYRYVNEIGTAGGPVRVAAELYGALIGGEEVIVATVEPVVAEDDATDADVLQMVLDEAPVGLVVYDSDLRIMRVNRRVEEMGRIKPSHIGMRVEEAFPGLSRRLVDALRLVLSSGETLTNIETSDVDGVGTFLLNLFPIRRHEHRPADLVGCIFSDVTQRVAAERALAESERHRWQILATMLHAEEAERSRIATELHDDTVQVMTAALLSMDRVALIARQGGDARIESAVTHTRAVLEEATDRTRRLMFELRPAILHERGLHAALGLLVDQTARETGAAKHIDFDTRRYEPMIEELVYRTVREALANVRRHAHPTTITVGLHEAEDGSLIGEVRDDGRGFDPAVVQRRPESALHLGLESMAERIRAARGDVTITSAPGDGTLVRFSIPPSAGRAPSR
jgi:signal transduction histidine kinase